MKWDFNNDGKVTPVDVALIIRFWRECDVDGDGAVTLNDITEVIKQIFKVE